MLTLADVLTLEDLAAVREGLAGAAFLDGRKTAGGDAKKVKANRQTDGSDPKIQALLDFVGKAITRHPVFAAYARPARPLRLMFNRYGPGETYGMHVDDPMMGSGEARLRTDLSLTLFIDEPETYQGGGLVIDGLDGEREIKLSAGSMVIYATGALHMVTPVTAGVRTACVGWVQSQIRRGEEREILFDLSRVRGAMKPGVDRLLLDKSIAQVIRLWGEP